MRRETAVIAAVKSKTQVLLCSYQAFSLEWFIRTITLMNFLAKAQK